MADFSNLFGVSIPNIYIFSLGNNLFFSFILISHSSKYKIVIFE